MREPSDQKLPLGLERPADISRMDFCWRVYDKTDFGGSWGWNGVDSKLLLKEIVKKLHHFESMTWGQLEYETESHFISTDRFIREARGRLSQIGVREDQLFSLRLTGRRRVWGVRDVAILNIVWWDPNHEVCPSKKKHT